MAAVGLGGGGWPVEGDRLLLAEEGGRGVSSVDVFRMVTGSWIPETCFRLLLSVCFPFVLNIVGMFCWVFYHVFGVFSHAFCWVFTTSSWRFIHVFGFSFCTLGLLILDIQLPGSLFVFIDEMNTLFGCFGLMLEYEYMMLV